MNKKGLIDKVSSHLRDTGYKKEITIPKHRLMISDDDGNTCSFLVRQVSRSAMLTQEDIAAVIDACIEVTRDTLRHGESLEIHNFGSLFPHYRAPRSAPNPQTGETIEIQAHYVPKFDPGKSLRMAVRLYELDVLSAAPETDGGDA